MGYDSCLIPKYAFDVVLKAETLRAGRFYVEKCPVAQDLTFPHISEGDFWNFWAEKCLVCYSQFFTLL